MNRVLSIPFGNNDGKILIYHLAEFDGILHAFMNTTYTLDYDPYYSRLYDSESGKSFEIRSADGTVLERFSKEWFYGYYSRFAV